MNANRALKKRVISSTAVALSVAALAVAANAAVPATATTATETAYEPTGYVTAGIVTELSDIQADATAKAELTVDEAKISVVAASLKENEKATKWADRLVADVDDFIYIRETADEDGEIVGKLRRGDVANIVSKKKGWIKIKSGNVKGYVSKKYCVTGNEARKLYKSYDLDEMSTAISIEEEQALNKIAILAKAEKAAEAAEAQKAAEAAAAETATAEQAEAEAPAQTETTTTQGEAVSATTDDLTLLANLIWCEAGCEPYEGQLAVGAVVINRLNAGYSSSISGVIYQPYQFSPAGSGKLASAIANGSASASCYQAAQEALSGVSNIGNLKNFHRVRNDGTVGTVIGNHIFF